MFAPYQPTDDDRAVLANWDKLFGETDPIAYLIRRVMYFDKYYSYSDSGSVLRNGDKTLQEIREGIAGPEDRELAALLERNLYADDRSEIKATVPWMQHAGKYSAWAKLIRADSLTEEQAANCVGVQNGLKELLRQVYTEAVTYGPHLVWADDYARTRYYSGYRKDPLFQGVTLSPATYARVDQFAKECLTTTEFKRALVLGKSEYTIARFRKDAGDCLYSINRHDEPVLYFFFSKVVNA